MKSLIRTLTLSLSFAAVGVASAADYSVVILHPAGYDSSVSYAAANGRQYGVAQQAGVYVPGFWQNTPGSFVSLQPNVALYEFVNVVASDDSQQAGYGTSLLDGFQHALLWSGSAGSYVDLHPTGLLGSSTANAVADGMQGGWAFNPLKGAVDAMIWSGSAISAVNLAPADAIDSFVNGMGGGKQVGLMSSVNFQNFHAVMWSGSAGSVVDLHPAGAFGSWANATNGAKQVGAAYFDFGMSDANAVVWSGNAASAVNLHPASGFIFTEAKDVDNGKIVGYGITPSGNNRALLWTSESAASVVNLHDFLPAGFVNSFANGIDANGRISGYVEDENGVQYAVLWQPELYTVGAFQNPINDPATPESVFRKGRTLPIRFKLTDANGNVVPNELVQLTLTLIGEVESAVNQDEYVLNEDVGPYFRYDAGGQVYVYNLKTKFLQAGARYRITATVVSTGDTHSVTVGLN